MRTTNEFAKLRKTELTLAKGWEQQTAEAIAKVIVVLLAILTNLLRLIALTLFKFKRQLYKMAILILVLYGAFSAVTTVTYAPYAHAVEFPKVVAPLTERDNIVNFVHDTFGSDADNALAVAKCESGLRPSAVNRNWTKTVGEYSSSDYGLFQINDHYQGVTNTTFLFDYKVNTLMAKKIFDAWNHTFKAWTCGRHLGV